MNTNQIGADGQGDVALISFGILLIVGLNNFFGGGAIVYLTPRKDPAKLILPCFLWSIISALFFYPIFSLLEIVPAPYIVHVVMLGFLQSLFTFHQQVLLGRNKVPAFNTLVITQAILTAASLAIGYFAVKEISTYSFIYALYIGFAGTLILALAMTRHEWKIKELSFDLDGLKGIVKYGFFSQTSNVFQILAYRLAYVFLEKASMHAGVGIFSVGMQINEAAVTPVKSIATVQHAHISNSKKTSDNQTITISLMKIGLLITLLVALAVFVLPESFYLWVFSEEMEGVKSVLNWLCLGMGGLAISSICAHHFSGTGKHWHNTIGSLITLVLIISLGTIYIPKDGIVAAAWVSSAAYLAQAAYLLIAFMAVEKVSLGRMLKEKVDWTLMRNN